MTLLDRFRTTAPHKHPDAAVRLAFVEEVPLEERDLIAEVARQDEDPRVRRAAVTKLLDPPALAEVVRADADETVRAEALAMLRDIALEAFEGVDEGASLAAVERLEDQKTLALVAKGALRERTALDAVRKLEDVRARGSVARHAALEAARRAALDALADHDEIVAVAMNSDFRDSALAALDRLSGRADLEQVASRATNKSAAKRARSVLREMDEREAAARAEEAARAAEALQMAEVEAARARAAEAQRARADAEAAGREAAAARAMQDADSPAAADGDERTEHAAPVPDADEAAREQERATAQAAAEARARQEDEARADAAAAARRAEEQAASDARSRREALGRLRNLVMRAGALAARPDLTLKAAERALRDVRAALADMPPLPSGDDHDAMAQQLEAAQAALSPRALELREAADWQRFVNAGVQEQLCARMEALEATENPEALVTAIRDLQRQWREAADVPRAQADALWRRFKAAHDRLWPRCESWLAGQAVARADHLQKKIALCERVEELAESTHWLQTAEEIKALQAEWKTIGPASRGQEKAVWERFRAACDRFFTRRNDDLKRRKTVWAENLAAKEALCAKAEAVAESSDWDSALATIKALQAEWKAIGPVKKSRSEAIWLRFRAACDAFFARYAQRHDAGRAERLAACEAVCDELERLAAAEASEPPPDLSGMLRGIESRWQKESAVRSGALERRYADAWAAVVARWPAAVAGTDVDPETRRRRLESLCRRVEELAATGGGPGAPSDDATLSPAERLARQLKERLASNTIAGKVDDSSRWRAAAEEVRQAQAAWARVGIVPDEVRRPLADRFNRACRLVLDKAGASTRSSTHPGGPGRPGRPPRRDASGRVGQRNARTDRSGTDGARRQEP